MARGVNKVILIGNLGNDPEMRVMPNGGQVANVSIATSESWTDRNTGQKQERTEWHRVVFFNRLAEIVGQYLRKGSKIYVEGSIRTRKWQDQSGQDRYSTEIIGANLQMLDGAQGGQQQQQGGYDGYQQQAPQQHQQAPAQQGYNQQQAPQQHQGGYQGQQQNQSGYQQSGPSTSFDEDIPF